jgi:hypothetical protein
MWQIWSLKGQLENDAASSEVVEYSKSKIGAVH